MKQRLSVLSQRLLPLIEKLRAQTGVQSVEYMVEGITEGVYMPDRGFSGLPIYLLGDAQAYRDRPAHPPKDRLEDPRNPDPAYRRLR